MSSCLAEVRDRRGVGEQRAVDDAGKAALEGAQRLGGGISGGCAPFEVGAGLGGAAFLGAAIRWMAQLSWRLPVRASRWRTRLPDQTGSGAVPLWRA